MRFGIDVMSSEYAPRYGFNVSKMANIVQESKELTGLDQI
jgi:hypothetical protein